MPDDQFAPQSTLQASFPGTEEILTTRSVASDARRTPTTVEIGPDDAAKRQEALIRRAFAKVDTTDVAPPSSRAYTISKRAIDLALTVPALIVLGPIMLLIAIAIRLDSTGPALFVQNRVGQGGRIFPILKFRSMSDGCSMLNGSTHKRIDDHRVTRVGVFLRKTSLDELPQLINVLLGQMSLVGPRPELPEIVLQKYEPWQYQRLSVPQGITGWWQVTGRGKKLLWKNTGDDLYYIERASFWFDIKLLALTVKAVFSRDGAF